MLQREHSGIHREDSMDGVGLGQDPQVSLDMRDYFCNIKYKLRR